MKWYRLALIALSISAASKPLWAQKTGTVRDFSSNSPLAEVKNSAEQGDPAAELELGRRYHNGQGVQQDDAQAVSWFRKAAEQGTVSAQQSLCAMRLTNFGTTNLGNLPEGAQVIDPDRTPPITLEEGSQWCLKGAENGDALSQMHLGESYEFGLGVHKDSKTAFRWMLKAAAQGYAGGQFFLGTMYANGHGVPQDYAQAVAWYRKAAEQGDSGGQYALGTMYANGHGVPQDDAQAASWFRKAAEQGDSAGQTILGAMYATGHGVPQDYAQAVAWYRKAAEQGDSGGQYALGTMYANGHGVPQDDAQAASWFRKAAEQGDSAGQTILGAMYATGHGVPQDYAQAVAWYRKAAEQGDSGGQYALGAMYATGHGVPQDYAQAVAWYRKAAEQGDSAGQTILGAMYADGQGVPQDYAQAVSWYRKAAEQGFANAQYELARCYENGKGVDQDDREAVNWYQKAADQDFVPAHRDHKPGDLWDDARATRFERRKDAAGAVEKPETAAAPASTGAKGPPSENRQASDGAKGPPSENRQASEVDTPTFRSTPNPNNFALVVGIEKYQKLPAAQFAEHDAETVRNYLLRMGFPERNIVYLDGENATRSRLSSYLEEWLPKNVTSGSTVFVYFSGHGAPGAENKQAYLVPWDGDAEFLKSTAYPLKRLYADLNGLKAKRKIVVLDSCFSGTGGRSVLVAGARPLVPEVATQDDLGGVVLFAATSADEITGTLDKQGHGIFTYYFLKGLSGKAKGSEGAVTANGLFRYLKPLVQDAAHRQNREQTPMLEGAPSADLVLRK